MRELAQPIQNYAKGSPTSWSNFFCQIKITAGVVNWTLMFFVHFKSRMPEKKLLEHDLLYFISICIWQAGLLSILRRGSPSLCFYTWTLFLKPVTNSTIKIYMLAQRLFHRSFMVWFRREILFFQPHAHIHTKKVLGEEKNIMQAQTLKRKFKQWIKW